MDQQTAARISDDNTTSDIRLTYYVASTSYTSDTFMKEDFAEQYQDALVTVVHSARPVDVQPSWAYCRKVMLSACCPLSSQLLAP